MANTSTSRLFSVLSIFNRDPSGPQANGGSSSITGPPSVIAQCVYNDILAVKSDIKNYNQFTGILSSNTLYYKLYKLIECDQQHELSTLKKTHDYDTKSIHYQRQLVTIYKKHLRDLQDLLDILNYNYNHGVHERHIVQHRQSKVPQQQNAPQTRNGSVVSDTSNNSSNLSLNNAVNSDSESIPTTNEPTKNDVASMVDEDAPDYILDPISFQLFHDPVITPSGITYEKNTLLEHLQKRGKYDPLTRTPLKESQIYPNLFAKNAVLEYINGKQQQMLQTT